MEEVTIYKFQLEEIEDALRIARNTLNCNDMSSSKNALSGNKDKMVKYGIKK